MKIVKRNNIDLLLPFKIAVSSENWYKIQHILFNAQKSGQLINRPTDLYAK